MAQIQVRDSDGHGIPRISIRIIEGARLNPVVGDDIFDYDTDLAGNKTWPIPKWPTNVPYTLLLNATDVNSQFEQGKVVQVPAAQNGQYGDIAITLDRPSLPVPALGPVRAGIVRADNRSWRDDSGLFYPLGASLFWALSGWKNERDRIRQNWSFLRSKGWDYQRATGDLNWAGQDASSSDFEVLLGDMIDAAWTEYGLRTEITAFAGPSPRDPVLVAQKVKNVISSRRDRVLFVEAANESSQSGPPDQQLDNMVRVLQGSGVPTASSTPMGDNNSGQWTQWLDARRTEVETLHLDRSTGDDDWRFVRQPWDFRDRQTMKSNNEPKGPRSSVSETTNIPRLVTHRLMSILAGLSAFVLHNGAGVAGKVDPAHNRPANLWEVPGIDEIMHCMRGLDSILPERLETWQKTTQHGGWAFGSFENFGNPLMADAIWSDGHGHGASRCYGTRSGNKFLTPVYGIDKYVILRAKDRCHVKLYDIVTQSLLEEKDLQGGEDWRVNGTVGTEASYVVLGETF